MDQRSELPLLTQPVTQISNLSGMTEISLYGFQRPMFSQLTAGIEMRCHLQALTQKMFSQNLAETAASTCDQDLWFVHGVSSLFCT